jgi:hypothetical protein
MEGARGPGKHVAVGASVAAVVAVAVAFRLHALARLPGINGDEAWYGVVAARLGAAGHSWLTPSGNPPAPFQLGLLALFDRTLRVLPPSFAMLRVPAVLASLVQLGLTFFVARRHLGQAVALVAVLLTAALPIEIAYARFGWDPSHTGFVAVAALHFALVGRAPAVLALFALAVWVHPTNVFLAPWLVASLVFGETDWRRAARRAGSLALGGGALALVALVALALAGAAGGRAAAVLWRVVDPRQWARFALALVRLLDGDTVLTFITGSGLGAARALVDAAVAVALGFAVVRGGRRVVAGGDPRKLGLVVGWLATLVAFFVFAGPDALRPHVERYGVCLLVPTIVALAVLVVEAGAGQGPVVAVAVASAALLGLFWRGYFVALETTGSTSHETFWTGPVEPKAEAFRLIEAETGGRPTAVLADGYWLYWPLAYLARGSRLDVQDVAAGGGTPTGAAYLVGFPDGSLDRWARAAPHVKLRWEIPGAGGRVVLRVWETPP